MKYIKFLLLGTVFGIVLSKAEIVSWYRIYEMFRFESFHMYGVIMSAVVLGVIIVQVIKRNNMNDFYGNKIIIHPKEHSIWRYLIGGTFFGLGWALIGACPGPIFILIGHGYLSIVIVLIGALAGTFLYGIIRNQLPH